MALAVVVAFLVSAAVAGVGIHVRTHGSSMKKGAKRLTGWFDGRQVGCNLCFTEGELDHINQQQLMGTHLISFPSPNLMTQEVLPWLVASTDKGARQLVARQIKSNTIKGGSQTYREALDH